MAGRAIKVAGRPIAQMPQEHLAPEIKVRLDGLGKLGKYRVAGDLLVIGLQLAREDVSERQRGRVTIAEHESLPMGHVELHTPNASAILSTVVLFLHEEEELVESVKRRAMFLRVVTGLLEKAHKGNATFMCNVVTHGKCRVNRREHRRSSVACTQKNPCRADTGVFKWWWGRDLNPRRASLGKFTVCTL